MSEFLQYPPWIKAPVTSRFVLPVPITNIFAVGPSNTLVSISLRNWSNHRSLKSSILCKIESCPKLTSPEYGSKRVSYPCNHVPMMIFIGDLNRFLNSISLVVVAQTWCPYQDVNIKIGMSG